MPELANLPSYKKRNEYKFWFCDMEYVAIVS